MEQKIVSDTADGTNVSDATKPSTSVENDKAETASASRNASAFDDADMSTMSDVESLNAGVRQMSNVLYWRFFVNLVLMILDGTMLVIANLIMFNIDPLAYLLYGDNFRTQLFAGILFVVFGAVYVGCLHSSGIYHRHVMGDGFQVNYKIVQGVVKLVIIQCAVNYMFKYPLPRHVLFEVAVLTLVFTVIERIIARVVITRRRKTGMYSYATIVVGSPECIERTLHRLHKRSQLNYRTVGVCPIGVDPETNKIVSVPIPDTVHIDKSLTVLPYSTSIGETAVKSGIQTILICDVIRRDSVEFNVLSLAVESLGVEIALAAGAADMGAHRMYFRNIQGMPVLTMHLPQYGYATRLIKRVFDIVCSLLLIILSSPITIITAIAIKLDDHGPVFYTQKRIGLRGKPFRMIKFRSMVTNADELKAKLAAESGQSDRFIFKMKKDPRITKVGHVIRKWSIDELPQFFNVLKGDMSLVGPRPPLPEEYARYNRLYATRMFVKPGITGPWQVSGRSDLTAEESEQLDVSYVQDWSITGDITILFKTVQVVLTHKGAY